MAERCTCTEPTYGWVEEPADDERVMCKVCGGQYHPLPPSTATRHSKILVQQSSEDRRLVPESARPVITSGTRRCELTCPCEPLHEQLRERERALDRLRAKYWDVLHAWAADTGEGGE